jgi:UDP-N-acetylglucosamine 4-epimerase
LISNKKILITGGAGFIGSNLCDYFIAKNNSIICLDNFATGRRENIAHLSSNKNFTLIEGDIRDVDTCKKACLPAGKAGEGVDYILHQAALGSVPRSINDPITTNSVNIDGFLNMLVAARDSKVKRFVYAASSSTYGDSETLPKVEEIIGKPLSPYAVTKYVNELYAHVFGLNYGIECIGLRYFNVYGRRQDPNGAYAAAIPKFCMQLMKHESPVINGDGTHSRDFTYIDNVLLMNELALSTTNQKAIGEVFNTAVGDRTDLNQLLELLKTNLSKHDAAIAKVEVIHGPTRNGDIPHSLASIDKSKTILGYSPSHNLERGLMEAVEWYWGNLKES